jgi:PAS domain S-box-containing protein
MELDSRIAGHISAGANPTDEQFRLLVSSVLDYAIFLLDVSGRVVSWNAGAERIKGYLAGDIVGRHFSLFYSEEDRAAGRPEQALARAERDGRFQAEGWRLRKDGTQFWADVVITALRDPAGRLRGFAKVTRDMTARQREREQQYLLAAMFEHAPTGIALADRSGRYVRTNSAFQRLLGYSEAELRGKTIGELTHPEDAEENWRVFQEMVQGLRNRVAFEKRYVRQSGGVIWVRNTVARVPDAQGRLQFIVAMVEDVTERRQAQLELQESEARLQAFTNHSAAVMFLKDREGRYRLVNDQFLLHFGLRREQVLGRRDSELFTQDQAAAFAANDALVLARGAPMQFEEIARYVGGERINVVAKFPVFDAAGEITGIGGVATDITERKLTEQALLEQRTLLSEAQKLAGLGCWEWDPASGRVVWSEELYRIYGVSPESFTPSFEGYLERVHAEDRQQAGATVARALAENRGFRFEERIVRPDGSLRYLRTHGEVVRDESGRALKLLGACLDVTEQKAVEKNLQALTRRLVEAEEIERRRIARELHDRVGQNLSALNINLDIVLAQLKAPAELVRRLEDSLALVDGTLQSIENVMADLRPPLLEEYGLGAALAWYAEEFSQRTGVRVSVSDPHEAGKPLRQEAAVALFRIAQEALNNIAKHARAKTANVVLDKDSQEVALCVSDDGCGFDVAKGAASGRWGMSTMRERAEAAGGRLTIDSRAGRGTRVRATVPL